MDQNNLESEVSLMIPPLEGYYNIYFSRAIVYQTLN